MPTLTRSSTLSLAQKMKFSAADLRALDAGSPRIKTLETPIREELAFAAA
jgi:hypothetical protein